MDDLIDAEIEVLRILNGEDGPGWCWGAAMSECLTSLKGRGYAAGFYYITDKGKAFLADRAIAGEGE